MENRLYFQLPNGRRSDPTLGRADTLEPATGLSDAGLRMQRIDWDGHDATVDLEPGVYRMSLVFFDAGGAWRMSLFWTPPGGVRGPIRMFRRTLEPQKESF